jgi:hypothetical protein
MFLQNIDHTYEIPLVFFIQNSLSPLLHSFLLKKPRKKKKHMCVAEYKLQLREGKRKEIFYLAAS